MTNGHALPDHRSKRWNRVPEERSERGAEQ